MSAVTVQEIVSLIEGLIESDACMGSISDKQVIMSLEVVSRIEQHGIAPPDGMVLVPVDPTDAMQTAHDMYGDTSDWWNAVISAVIRAAAEIGRMK